MSQHPRSAQTDACSGKTKTASSPPVMALLFALSCGLWVTACGTPACDEPRGYDEGEHFRITVLGTRTDGSCNLFEVGDSFVLEAAPWIEAPAEHCGSGALGPAPVRAEDVPECRIRSEQLAMQCTGRVEPTDCGPSLSLRVAPEISRRDRVIEDGTLFIEWLGVAECTGGCAEQLIIRIEALDRE